MSFSARPKALSVRLVRPPKLLLLLSSSRVLFSRVRLLRALFLSLVHRKPKRERERELIGIFCGADLAS